MRDFSLGRIGLKTIGLSLLILGANQPLHAQLAWESVITLRIAESTPVVPRWKPVAATLSENYGQTTGRLTIRNTGPEAVRGVRFLASYLDREERMCFSLAFTQDSNSEATTNPFLPGETRTLVASASGLAPAAEPVEVRIEPIEGPLPRPPRASAAGMRTPVTVLDVAAADKVWPPTSIVPAHFPGTYISLALAVVEVDPTGHLAKADILSAASTEVRAWFASFVAGLSFASATSGDAREAGKALLLFRAIDIPGKGNMEPSPVRDDPWVRSFVKDLGTKDLPVVELLRFERASNWPQQGPGEPHRSPDDWFFVSLGTEWSSEAVAWVPDPSGHGTRRSWRTTEQQPTLKLSRE